MKLTSLFITGMLVLALGGCADAGTSGSQAGAEPPAGGSQAAESETEPIVTGFAVHSDFIGMDITVDKTLYDHDSIIATKVVITNVSDQTIAYVMGSGANIAPDALAYNLDNLVKLFVPQVMTMDYRVEVLEPGQTLELDLNFAPYIAKDENALIGTDKTIEDFKNDDFTEAPAGTVNGKAVFTFRRLPADADENALLTGLDDIPADTVELDFQVEIA